MAVIPLPPERFAEVQQALREMEPPRRRPEVVNEEAVLALDEPRGLVYRGRRYSAAPLSFRHGQRLQALTRAMDAAGKAEDDAALAALVERAVSLFHEIVRPRWLRWLPNPFRHASEAEVGALMGFFHACRLRSGVRHDAQPAGSSRPR